MTSRDKLVINSDYDRLIDHAKDGPPHWKNNFCHNCTCNLCGDCQLILHYLQKKDADCEQLYKLNAFFLGLSRLPALFVTLVLEMFGGFLINELNDSIAEFLLLASFLPVISAISGNLGLQASSNTTRGLATHNIPIENPLKNIWKEIKAGLFSSLVISTVLASTAVIWTLYDTKDKKEIEHRETNVLYPLYFAFVIFVGTFVSMMISSVNGSLMPVLAQKCKLDPAKVAGPLETAFQDIVGQAFLLGFSAAVLLPMFRKLRPITTASPSSFVNHLTTSGT